MQCDKIGIGINYKSHKYLVVGGDSRQMELARLIKESGYEVATLGMEKANINGIINYSNIDKIDETYDVIIGPIPFSKVVNVVNNIYSDNLIEIDKLFEKIGSNKIFFAGAMNKSSRDMAQSHNIDYIDYYWDESYQILNAIPTAEGTIALLVNETDITIHDSNILILGYGRIGKKLADYLKALGANVYVEARKDSDIANIKSKTLKAIHICNLVNSIGQMDIVINTIPSMILDKDLLDVVKVDTLLIDLASIPGGVDFEYAKGRGIKAIHALGIPGKIAYKTAAVYIYNCIMKLLENLE